MANSDDQENIILTYDFVEHETDNAYWISFGDEPNVCLPKSLTTIIANSNKIAVPLWLAIEKEIEIYEE